MKSELLDILVCPACLPAQNALTAKVRARGAGGDIISGTLVCGICGLCHPVEEGVAILLPDGRGQERTAAHLKYESEAVLAAYLWSQYADLLGETSEPSAYASWAGMMEGGKGRLLDAGCAVGRFVLELSGSFDLALGVDLSWPFVRAARQLALAGEMTFNLPTEGNLTEKRTIRIPHHWNRGQVEFVVADAGRLPFRAGAFSGVSSLNLVDKLPEPLRHLEEMDRVAVANGAEFLFSDPFSWSTEIAREEDWLGGTLEGPFAGRGLDNVVSLLENRLGNWRILKREDVWWTIRNHENHFEKIRSRSLKAFR